MKNQVSWFRFASAIIIVLFVFLGCSSGGGGGDDDSSDTTTDTTTTASVAEILVEAENSSINVEESAEIIAWVYDDSGSPMANTTISFSLDYPSLAYISPSIATTNSDGKVTATLTARSKQGEIIVSASNDEITSNDETVSILSGVSPDTITVTATPMTLLIGGTSSIQAEVLDKDGNAVPDGTSVSFEVANDNFGSMSPATNTTANGFASSTFTSSSTAGTVAVEVSVGQINNSVDLIINDTQPASLSFNAADPEIIAIKESGGNETSDISFQVIDQNGDPKSGIAVTMTIIKGPGGGEYIDTDSTPEEIVVSSASDGLATVTLHSGSNAGPVTIRAQMTVDGVAMVANSAAVSIGGGVPSASRFSVSASVLNIPGLDENGKTTEITAWLTDRFGNYNILEGTTVSFWSEAALAVDAANVTASADGSDSAVATVTARTQHPVIDPIPGGEDVAPFDWENELMDYVSTTYGWAGTTHPRDGLVSILVYTEGEEGFDDLNANGVYDSGETFEDTIDDPFIDYNDNGEYDGTDSSDPAEIYNDANDTTGWDSYNGIWDDQKDIFYNFKILITGEPHIAIAPTTFNIADGGSQSFTFLVCDENLNYLSEGTSISVSIEGGGKLFADEIELDDSSALPGINGSYTSHLPQIEYNATIMDSDSGDSNDPVLTTLTITVNWEGNTEELSIIGYVD
ncbi:invasin domain 3-containing protein [Desulfosarcina ovata]|uniref:Big-1 domain-containing protein n=1 Tax=Desulfosarcina ovata subsp. ovata TaxID=2752305 RepID=A0A5K8ADX3_9BACT|nr:invasin domain 3-containing protein [Desulfosarcina ovata]BBO90822.1 hypothetical protein DSCOOX_40020 [Desulfosarcina ovata subsp. ovata]